MASPTSTTSRAGRFWDDDARLRVRAARVAGSAWCQPAPTSARCCRRSRTGLPRGRLLRRERRRPRPLLRHGRHRLLPPGRRERVGRDGALAVDARPPRTGPSTPTARCPSTPGSVPDDTVLFNGVDSGGVCLEWLRSEGIASGMAYDELEGTPGTAPAVRRGALFLPYLTGVNPPDTSPTPAAPSSASSSATTASTWPTPSRRASHTSCGATSTSPHPASRCSEIVSTGGGCLVAVLEPAQGRRRAASRCSSPTSAEATCRGAAVLAFVAAGELGSIEDTARTSTGPPTRCAATDLRSRTPRRARRRARSGTVRRLPRTPSDSFDGVPRAFHPEGAAR